jgi:hypothetical protein
MANRKSRKKIPEWKIKASEEKKERLKQNIESNNTSSVPDEYKIVKKKKVSEVKKNHYLNKSDITIKLEKYRNLHFFLKSFKDGASEFCSTYQYFAKELKKLKDDLIVDYYRAGKELLKSPKFRSKPSELKYEMLSHSVERMYYYGYFYTFNVDIGREGFSWLTSCHYNYFIQVINDHKKYSDLRLMLRDKKIYQMENTNHESALDDHSVCSLVKGIKYNNSDMIDE